MASKQLMIFIGRVMKKKVDWGVDDLELREDDVRKDVVDGVPFIEFLNRINTLIEESMSTTVVVKLVGRRIGYNALWNKCGRFSHLKEGCPFVNKEDAMEGDEIHHQGKSIETQQNGVTGFHKRVEKENLENG
ncbi:hypothetical protein GOBAR_AA03431 [Gossypium barbadense]|uniref:Uncharacterized protein n=1 Tax=Gossypium barbadense TaxID=3634 RepID=A0A2P5YNH5_GOSBA|nr:hypothetical protein GOBAR_AA03431 [Gossypium barbadense]